MAVTPSALVTTNCPLLFMVILVILSLIVGGSIWTHRYYENTKNEFENKLKILEDTIDDENNKEKNIQNI